MARSCEVCKIDISHMRASAKFCCTKHRESFFRKNNPDKVKAYDALYRKNNPNKVKVSKALYQKTNADKHCAHQAKRRADKLRATPFWLTKVDKERIQNEYKLAALQTKITGESWHVDHIIPLKGKLVCGFHVPSNLKATRGKDNISKNNKFEIL
jgi:hypothetical protein